MEEKKTCVKCHKELPKTEEYFNKNKNTKDGFEGQCKNCRREYFKKFRAGKRVRSKQNKSVQDPGLKKKYVRQRDPVAPAPIQTATPAEILIALRKGMASEIVAMIKEKNEL